MQQEAELCALLYPDESLNDFTRKCMVHINKLLRGFGYVRNLKKHESQIVIEHQRTEIEVNNYTILEILSYLYCCRNISIFDLCYRLELEYTDELEKTFIDCFGERGSGASFADLNGRPTGELIFNIINRKNLSELFKNYYPVIYSHSTDRTLLYLRKNKRNSKR